MTHDELLAKMSKPAHNLNANDARNVYLLALRAVVELHKPISYPSTSGLPLECTVCRAEPYYSTNEAYPCPTIQAIKKALN